MIVLCERSQSTQSMNIFEGIFLVNLDRNSRSYIRHSNIFVKFSGGFTDSYLIIFVTIIKVLHEYYTLLYVRNILEKNFSFKNQASCFVLMHKQLKKK